MPVKTLRFNLMTEEYLELLKAEAENDRVEIADALCDLKYVLNGTIIAHGLHNHWTILYNAFDHLLKHFPNVNFRLDDYLYSGDEGFIYVLLKLDYFIRSKVEFHGLTVVFGDMFNEVHRSNMSKTCRNEEVAIATCLARMREFDTECHYASKDGYFLVYRTSDQKTLKSVEYSPANLAQFLPEYNIN